jgi:hypothetical protein
VQWQPGAYAQKNPVKKDSNAAPKEESNWKFTFFFNSIYGVVCLIWTTTKGKAYVPPHLRGANKMPADFKSKLHEDDEKPDKNLKIKEKTLSAEEEIEKKIKGLRKVGHFLCI